MKKGFTLIELLVVITLIGILAVAVLSAINPIEQINKAKDAGKRADASQLISALDRYFASNLKFPWNNYLAPDGIDSIDAAFIASAKAVGVGVCTSWDNADATDNTQSDASGCTPFDTDHYGYLIETQELKSQFAKRSYFKDDATTGVTEQLYVIKQEGDPSVSVCFVPQSKAVRDTWDDLDDATKITKLKDLSIADGLPTVIEQWDREDAPDYTALETSAFVCIPEE